MAGKITKERKEQLIALQDQLKQLETTMQLIIDGKTSMNKLAESLGTSPQVFNKAITNSDNNIILFLKRVKILTVNDLEDLIRESMSPAERLIASILRTSDLFIIDISEEEILLDILDNALVPRESEVIKHRFGFVDGKPKTLDCIAKLFNVNKETIRQIEAKALRKLRNPKHLRRFIPNYDIRIKNLEELEAINYYNREILLREDHAKAEAEKEIFTEVNKKLTIGKFLNADIEKLKLSARSYNCLKRAGIRTIGELAKKDINDLIKIRNIGSVSLKEIVDKLAEYDINIRI